MKKINVTPLLLACGLLTASAGSGEEIPKDWFKAGKAPKDYEASVDRDTTRNGKPSASLKSIAAKPDGFATLMQMAKADAYRGKRLRLSGYVQSKDVGGWAGMWLRIDGPKGEPLGFDNMEKRPIKGTTDWKKYEIVVDVPQNAKELAFGLMLTGTGQLWMADLNFDVVGKDVASTSMMSAAGVQSTPTNLSFDK
jgi:hypothetical protein